MEPLFAGRYGLTLEELNREFDYRTRLLYEMRKRRIFDFNQNQKIFNEYHKDPVAVLRAFGIPLDQEIPEQVSENPAYETVYQ